MLMDFNISFTLPTPGLDSIDITTATSDGWSACLPQTVVHIVVGVQVSPMLEKNIWI